MENAMSTTWFPYSPGLSMHGDRPCVPVQFVRRTDGAICEPVPVLIDTGADCTVLPAMMGEQLGINLDGAREHTNRLGHHRADPGDGLIAIVAGVHVLLRPRFTDKENVVVLGRYDFLAHFRLTIDELGQRFGLEPYPGRMRGKHPHQAPACGVLEPDPAPDWTTNGQAA
jgi:hypothetical protein